MQISNSEIRSMNLPGFYNRVLLIFLFTVLEATGAAGTGFDDFSFDLPGKYFVLRANAADIRIWRRGVGTILQEVNGQKGLGPLYELAFDDQFIFTRNLAYHTYGDTSEVPSFWTIIDYTKHVVYGPFPEADFQRKVIELGVSQPIRWNSLKRAFKEAMEDGRVNIKEYDLQSAIALMFTAILWVIVLPVLIAIALLPALVGKFAFGRSFRKSFAWFSLAVVVISFLWIVGGRIFTWFYMRFL